jgi:hypothetical protein
MTAFNVVRFRVKPGRDEDFLEFHRNAVADFAGYRGGVIIKTGDRSYCFVAGWDDFDSIVAARPQMIGMLDHVRDMLEDLGGGLGVTDPVSGETVVELPAKAGGAGRRSSQKRSPRKRGERASSAKPRRAREPAAGGDEAAEPDEEA